MSQIKWILNSLHTAPGLLGTNNKKVIRLDRQLSESLFHMESKNRTGCWVWILGDKEPTLEPTTRRQTGYFELTYSKLPSIFICIQWMQFHWPPDMFRPPGIHHGMAGIGERYSHVVFHLLHFICGNFLNHPHWSAADVGVIKLQSWAEAVVICKSNGWHYIPSPQSFMQNETPEEEWWTCVTV